MSKTISQLKIDDTLSLTECNDGFWLYDYTAGMNLSMKAKTKDEAFIAAIKYYQKRLLEYKSAYNSLKCKVDNFVNEFIPDDMEIDENEAR